MVEPPAVEPSAPVDLRHLPCPGPVMELRKLLDAGDRAVTLWVADELARSNVSRFASSRGARAAAQPHAEGGFLVAIEAGPGASSPAPDEPEEIVCEVPQPQAAGPRVVQITSERMGEGDDALGELLMRSFLKTLGAVEPLPDRVVFYNSGVRLCCAGSTALEALSELEERGVEILACGTCLNFFGLAESLSVGRGTDMLEIVTRLSEAGALVRP